MPTSIKTKWFEENWFAMKINRLSGLALLAIVLTGCSSTQSSHVQSPHFTTVVVGEQRRSASPQENEALTSELLNAIAAQFPDTFAESGFSDPSGFNGIWIPDNDDPSSYDAWISFTEPPPPSTLERMRKEQPLIVEVRDNAKLSNSQVTAMSNAALSAFSKGVHNMELLGITRSKSSLIIEYRFPADAHVNVAARKHAAMEAAARAYGHSPLPVGLVFTESNTQTIPD